VRGVFSERPDLTIPQVQIVVQLPEQAEGMKAIDMSFVNKTEAWIEVK